MDTGVADVSVTERILKWYIFGETGLSSKAIAALTAGYLISDSVGFNVPHDPSDLRRCLLLLREVPETREKGLDVMAARYPLWKEISAIWDQLEKTCSRRATAPWHQMERERLRHTN